MGFDVTFHSISGSQLQRFVLDVLADPTVAEARAREITDDRDKVGELLSIYRNLEEYVSDAEAGKGGGQSVFAYGVAAIAGYLHPYWYCRGSALSFCVEGSPDLVGLFRPYASLGCKRLRVLESDDCLISENYSGSGIITDMDRLLSVLLVMDSPRVERKGFLGIGRVTSPPILDTLMVAEQKASLWQAVYYCGENGLWFLEASDLVVPISDECYTDFENLRADFADK